MKTVKIPVVFTARVPNDVPPDKIKITIDTSEIQILTSHNLPINIIPHARITGYTVGEIKETPDK